MSPLRRDDVSGCRTALLIRICRDQCDLSTAKGLVGWRLPGSPRAWNAIPIHACHDELGVPPDFGQLTVGGEPQGLTLRWQQLAEIRYLLLVRNRLGLPHVAGNAAPPQTSSEMDLGHHRVDVS